MLKMGLIGGCFLLSLFWVGLSELVMSPVRHQACKSGNKPLEVLVGPCKAHPCSVKRGEGGQIQLKFLTPKTTKTVMFGGVVLKDKDKLVHLPKIDFCKEGFVQCPLEANHTYTIKAKGPVPNVIPPGSYAGDVWLEGDFGKIVCLRGILIIT